MLVVNCALGKRTSLPYYFNAASESSEFHRAKEPPHILAIKSESIKNAHQRLLVPQLIGKIGGKRRKLRAYVTDNLPTNISVLMFNFVTPGKSMGPEFTSRRRFCQHACALFKLYPWPRAHISTARNVFLICSGNFSSLHGLMVAAIIAGRACWRKSVSFQC